MRRFYEMGFNIEATAGTAAYLKSFGIRTRVRGKISEGSSEILDSIRSGYVSYIINTRSIHSSVHAQDGAAIRRCAVENGVTVFTSLDTVRVLLDVLEETTGPCPRSTRRKPGSREFSPLNGKRRPSPVDGYRLQMTLHGDTAATPRRGSLWTSGSPDVSAPPRVGVQLIGTAR